MGVCAASRPAQPPRGTPARREGIACVRALDAFVLRDQMQVVVAEYDDRAIREPFTKRRTSSDFGPRLTRSPTNHSRSATHRTELAEQPLQLVVAALHVADRVRRHRRTIARGCSPQNLIASAMCSAAIEVFCARSAMVRATRNTR